MTDAADGVSHAYEGVDLGEVIRETGTTAQAGAVEVSFGKRQKLNLPGGANLFVVDTVDGRRGSGYVPYYAIVKGEEDSGRILNEVECITITPRRSL
jgi:hypothetical protein